MRARVFQKVITGAPAGFIDPRGGLFAFCLEGGEKEGGMMKKIVFLTLCCLAPLIFLAGGAWGAEFCVDNATDLVTALSAAMSNGEDDIIKVVQGTYTGYFGYGSGEGKSIAVLGGYTAGCAGRVVNPANTVLDGNHSGGVLYLYNDSGGDIEVDGFTMQNGVAEYYGGGVFAFAYSSSGTAGPVTLTNNIITGNSAAESGGGVYAYSASTSGTAGSVLLFNNIITGNSVTKFYGGGVDAQSTSSGTAGTVTLLNNTITGNGAAEYGGGVYLAVSAGGIVNCYNNIIWGNTATTGDDIYLGGSGTNYGYNNDYHDLSGTWTSSGGPNIDADPQFVGAGDYHLRPASPCIDTGLNGAPGIPATDFDGDDRIIDGNNDGTAAVDMGADEFTGFLPANGTIFVACSLINKYQPSFQWRFTETFKSFTIYFSTSPTDFTTKGILIKKANIKGTKFSYTPSSGVWKKIFTASWNGGSIRPIYWKVTGTRQDKSTVSSVVWHFTVDAPYPPEITYPAGPYPVELHAATPPTFQFDTMCNVKFRLEVSSVGDFSDPKKIKAFAYSVKDPNVTDYLQKTLSSGQWKAVQKLITGTGYFRIRAWDVIKRETHSETRSFTITTP